MIKVYRTPSGVVPYLKWFKSIVDLKTRAKIQQRLRKIEQGYLGDYKPLKNGVGEFRLDFGPGYRIYYGQEETVIFLLLGGDKSSQNRDILKAQEYWQLYKETRYVRIH